MLSVNPVVAECNDGFLNDIRARVVTPADIVLAIQAARSGPVQEGCVGAGTGVRCMGWKGGIGTSSRRLPSSLGGFTVGVLVQTNFGGSLTIDGVPIGRALDRYYLKNELRTQEHGSCIVIVATNAPLDARRLQRLANRAPLGLGAVGSSISHGSGDYVLAFSTDPALRTAYQSETPLEERTILRDDQLSPLFQAVKDATEEAVINSLLQATTTTGFRGHRVEAIEPEQVVEVLKKYGRSVTFPLIKLTHATLKQNGMPKDPNPYVPPPPLQIDESNRKRFVAYFYWSMMVALAVLCVFAIFDGLRTGMFVPAAIGTFAAFSRGSLPKHALWCIGLAYFVGLLAIIFSFVLIDQMTSGSMDPYRDDEWRVQVMRLHALMGIVGAVFGSALGSAVVRQTNP